MKNKYVLKGFFLVFLSFLASVSFAKQYTSVKSGNWNNKTTWGATTAPAATDTTIIAGGFTVTVSATATINKVTVNSGSTLKLSRNLTVSKIFINNGTVTGTRSLLLSGTGIVISGTGIYTGHTGSIQFNASPATINVGVVIQQNTGNVILNNTTTPGITVTNNGQVLLEGGNTLTTSSTTKASTFTMGANSVLAVSTAPLNNAFAVLNASAAGCNVEYYGGTYNIKIPSANTYYDLGIEAGTKTNTVNLIMHSLTVAAAGTFTVGGFNLTLSGDWTNNGTVKTNTGIATFDGTVAETITDGSGTAAFGTLIMSGTNTLNLASSVSTTSNLSISSGTVDATAANSNITDGGNFTNDATFTERKGTVTLNGGAAQSLGGTTSTTFYNLTLNGTTVTLGNDETISNTLLISGGTLDVSASNYSLTVGQNFTNDATFTGRAGTVTLTGNTTTPLNIDGTSGTTFYDLIADPTNTTDVVLLGRAATIGNNFTITKGTFNSQNFQVTGNATGKMTMAAGTSLELGLTTSATNILFPTNYTAANTTLNVTSTVTYQSNGAQTISAMPTYGNVIVTNGNAAATKTPTGTPLTIAGNLTITKGTGAVTMSQTTNTIDLTGNYTSDGILSFSTGNFNIGGNYSNNGTFTAGTSTVTFDGNAAQALGGTSVTTFNLLTINNSGAATITLGNNEITSSNLTITKGTLDVSATNYSLTVAGNFTNNASFTARAGTVTMNGAAAQTVGGTTSTSFYNLTLNGATVSLGNNETVTNTALISAGTLDASASNYNLTVGQNFTNNAAFTARNGTVTFTGNISTPLNIGGTATTSFYNLTTNPTNATDIVLLGRVTTVTNNFTISKGEFNSQNFQITGSATGKMVMAAGTNLLLGLTTSATNILFPSNYTAANTTLNVTSTVTYQTNGAQTISVTPTYGNVILTNGAAAATKTPSGTPLSIAGNLTLTKGTGALTMSETTNTINLTGSFTSNGILSFSTGAFNIGGNFTNNGTYTAGTGTVTFDGAAAQSLGGTTATTFDLLTINNSGSATITLGNNVTVSSIFTITKGTFDVSATDYSLTVAGNFLNSGSFNGEAGTVTLNGAANQSIGGTATTAFYSLTLSGKTITLNHSASLQGVLTLSTGALNGPDSLTMLSNTTGTARIAPVAAAATIGADFIMQRYVTGTTANYQCLSSPSKASILKDWDYDAGFYMSGVTGNDGNATYTNGKIYYSVYSFDEPKNTYDSVTTDNQPLTPGLGLYLWMGNSLSSFSPFTFDTRGIPNVGNINYAVTKSDKGTNLIGNPYDSPLQWTLFQAGNSARIGTTFYVFDETTGNWESSNGTTGSGGRIQTNPNILPAHEGFMVVASSAGVLTFKETHKSVTDAALVRIAAPSDIFRVSLTTNANTFSGHALLEFNDSASDLYSADKDAIHIKSHLDNVPVVYTLSGDGEELTHNTLPGKENTKDVILYAGGGDEGMYTLTFSNLSSLTKYNCVQLEDVKNGKWSLVSEGSEYSYTIEKGQMYKFILHFKALLPNEDCTVPQDVATVEQNSMEAIDILPSLTGAQVRFTLPAGQDVSISVFNTLGQQIGQEIRTNVMDNTVNVPLPSTHDIYIIRVQSPYGVLDKRIYH